MRLRRPRVVPDAQPRRRPDSARSTTTRGKRYRIPRLAPCTDKIFFQLQNRTTRPGARRAAAWRTSSYPREECGEPKPWHGRSAAEVRAARANRVLGPDPRSPALRRRSGTDATPRADTTGVWLQSVLASLEMHPAETMRHH